MDYVMRRIGIWDITSKCNLRCGHCYNQERYWDNASNYQELSKNNINIILDKLSDLNFTRVHLLGGEPLLCKNFLYIVEYARHKGLDVSLVTNGTLLTEPIITKLCDLGVSGINISLDGSNAQSNDAIRGSEVFNKAITNLKKAISIRNQKKSDMQFGISFTLTRNNLDNTDIVQFVCGLGVDGLFISYLSNEGEARKNYSDQSVNEAEKFNFIDKIFESYNNYNKLELWIDARSCLSQYIYKKFGYLLEADTEGCKGGNGQFYILADGTLLPCSPSDTSMGEFTKDTVLRDLAYPNLLKDSIDKISNSKSLVCFYNYAHNHNTYSKLIPCNECKYNCKPCPLLYHKNNIVKECVYANKLITEIDNETLKIPYKKSEGVRVMIGEEKTEILNFNNQNKYIFEGMSKIIWDLLDGTNCADDIISQLYDKYQHQVYRQTVHNDVLEFIYELKHLKLISI